MIKKTMKGGLAAVAMLLAAMLSSGCAEKQAHSRGVYLLVDTSGTYAKELDKAGRVLDYMLGVMNPGDSLAVARVKSRSFSEKDIIAKVTFDKVPSRVHAQKRQFREKFADFRKDLKAGSAHTDITGAMIQAAEFLNETHAGRKTILIFSDMQEELDKKTVRNFPIDLSGFRIVALNVTKLHTDNVDPRRYLGRLESWRERVLAAGAKEWTVVNDLEHLERVFRES